LSHLPVPAVLVRLDQAAHDDVVRLVSSPAPRPKLGQDAAGFEQAVALVAGLFCAREVGSRHSGRQDWVSSELRSGMPE
ncbi:hypothetical protein B8W95_13575, partial [Staphylococcus pasteuri]